MKIGVRDPAQTVQRVKVGLIGLATILFLIGLATAVLNIASRERPATAAGAPRADVAANLSMSNAAGPSGASTGEPLAELGIAPAASPTPTQH